MNVTSMHAPKTRLPNAYHKRTSPLKLILAAAVIMGISEQNLSNCSQLSDFGRRKFSKQLEVVIEAKYPLVVDHVAI